MSTWAAANMSMMPGMGPRPQHYICDKKDHTEEVNSTSNALYVFSKNCENTKVNINGKVGKVAIESSNGMEITISDRLVSGTLEIIKCKNMVIKLSGSAEIPILQIDDSSEVTIHIEKRSQIKHVYYIRCNALKILLNADKEYDIQTSEENAEIQQIARWQDSSADASFVTEVVKREGSGFII